MGGGPRGWKKSQSLPFLQPLDDLKNSQTIVLAGCRKLQVAPLMQPRGVKSEEELTGPARVNNRSCLSTRSTQFQCPLLTQRVGGTNGMSYPAEQSSAKGQSSNFLSIERIAKWPALTSTFKTVFGTRTKLCEYVVLGEDTDI